ncbi:tRNA (adenosine(37)-N6)-threonylcarbamoyltransferase complex dimerization subunit type 1 TsaB [Novacetimonas hansenii]|uniref:tRNA (adenosine(37)-N6)-threonylcarbamoyltransferase complex dimerization subunit type 1 TsaB n=1 Tax=Novacetimonas hansenii TaxID=436 RepID=UPI000789BE4D|nr:tRNA (adenosine(37)-N6)-threonylcarbamoyltransferase complex dimerization subunit type 1 TsaB [Novacetimonas hansenii]PYD73856.1 tRNA N6-adenosine(37)-N6-threonylcarbamoyltransferase complex dimerization subunit TsaB [Novacetimonas hansenii]RFP04913.1 tRNA (adenosine(37)-N6)-threonylcarbamoyltransferase complex dimerization subunit type 1 TsaB [Novacetimonas hansenii]WEQ58002.1 tRNA (adenosine(37)-N6)-threonylcarbamoyltransferase complex dimerization subunit type 1 TsaB [Novacetimonas hanseni
MRVLVLDGAQAGAQARALVACVSVTPEGCVVARAHEVEGRGGSEGFPLLARDLLAACGWSMPMLDMVAVVVGPGSFTGLRASVAFAQGLALGLGCDVIGVTTGEALADALRAHVVSADMRVLCCSVARRGRAFVESIPARNGAEIGEVRAVMLDDPTALPSGPLLLAGNAAADLAAACAQGRDDVHVLALSRPDACAIARVAMLRREGVLAPRAVLPLYVDPPEAKLPAAGLRPPPRKADGGT